MYQRDRKEEPAKQFQWESRLQMLRCHFHPTVAICNHFNSTDGIDLCVTFITVGYILYNNKCHQRDGFRNCLKESREGQSESFRMGDR